jgi:hypothetical protein
MYIENCWLPDLIYFEDYHNEWGSYEEALYNIFKHDFVDSKPLFERKRVNIRKHPMENNKEEAFYHITHRDYFHEQNRLPDLRRCERIRWVRSLIESHDCNQSDCEDCEGIKVWTMPYRMYSRTHLLFEKERYMVVIERRKNFNLLVTAFYFEHDHSLNKKLREYENNKKQQNEKNNG